MDNVKIYKLTNPQKNILLTEQYYKLTPINNVVGRIKFQEQIDINLLKKTLEIIIQQNDALRTRIIKVDGEYYQYFPNNVDNFIEIININEINQESKIVKELSRKYIKLINNNLMKFYILGYENGTADVLSVSHHIVADAWTVSLYAKEIIRIYKCLKERKEIEKATYSYIDYIEEENKYLESDKLEIDKKYWDDEYKEEPTTQFFDTCNNIKGKREHYIINKDETLKIKKFCKDNNISEQCLFMATFSIYLSKISSSYNISIGMPVLNRKNYKAKSTMGMFIDTLPLHVNINSNLKCGDFLKYINEKQYAFLKHHRYPFEMLQKDIKNKFDTNQKCYSVAFSYQNAKIENSEEMQCITSWEFNGYCPDDLQMHINDMQNTGTFNVYYDFKENGIENNEIKNIHSRLLYIINQIIMDDNMYIKDIEIITKEEKEQILFDFNNTKVEYNSSLLIHERINENIRKYPNEIAVIDEESQITYKELGEKSNILANELIEQKVDIGDVVAIIFERKSVDIIISALAALKVGASFIFLYNELPDERIKFILKDSNSKIIITETELYNKFNEIININIDNIKQKKDLLVSVKNEPTDVAYLIYTSGTTGKPKGTQQTHANLSNFINSFYDILDNNISKADNFLSVANVSFDVCIAEIFTPLFYGATLYLYKDLAKSTIDELVRYVVDKKITFSYFPPAILEEVVEKLEKYKEKISLNKMLVGVEPIKATTLEKFLDIKKDIHIINGYGPSETTICSTMYDFNNRKDKEEIVPIGKPINNTEIFIMNKDMNLLPIGTIGEIYILGKGIGKGYKCNESLQQEKYISIDGKQAFKTGDLGKWNKNGDINFCGRNDNQIKFRGYRIDLGEIENSLKSCNGVKNAVLQLNKKNDKDGELIAFVVTDNEQIVEENLREFLSKTLPYYMMPSKFIKLKQLPMTANGKIDKKKLMDFCNTEKRIILPENEIEKVIYDIIKKKTKNDRISINDNFFDLGIDSLEAISLIVEFEKRNMKFSLQDFYNYPSIKLLAAKMMNDNNTNNKEERKYISKIKYEKGHKQTISGNILLLGATGFLGIHILKELLQTTNVNVYCLVRATTKNKAIERLKDRLSYYFEDDFYENNNNRIIVVNGDFTLDRFGMNNEDYETIKKQTSMIINSAACVKHFGSVKYFYNVNYLSVKKAIEFCKHEDKQFIQISTMSVLENVENADDIDETTLYCNQKLENIYIKTKFEAEQEVAKAIKEGLNATIFRVGNIMWRNDGKFQINENENAFITKLKLIINYKIVLDSMLDYKIDLSPVDLCAEAIVKILKDNNVNIYHIENNNKITIKEIVAILKKLNINIRSVDLETYNKEIARNFQNKNELIGLLENDIENCNVNSEKSTNYLKELGFEWNNIDEEYIKKYIQNI